MEFELSFYATTVAAGDDVRIIPLAESDAWPEQVPFHDFWLFDELEMFELNYDSDGTWLGATLVAEPEEVARACRIRDAALKLSVPWGRCMHQRYPHLLDRLPAGAVT